MRLAFWPSLHGCQGLEGVRAGRQRAAGSEDIPYCTIEGKDATLFFVPQNDAEVQSKQCMPKLGMHEAGHAARRQSLRPKQRPAPLRQVRNLPPDRVTVIMKLPSLLLGANGLFGLKVVNKASEGSANAQFSQAPVVIASTSHYEGHRKERRGREASHAIR